VGVIEVVVPVPKAPMADETASSERRIVLRI